MPYAYGATITHRYTVDFLEIWLTFKHPMLRTLDPLAAPVIYDVMPPLALWLLEADSAYFEIVDSEWIDEHTLLLTSEAIPARPAEVFLSYDGPDDDLKTTWGKQWEAWGPTLSTDLTATLWQTGMIILWSGAKVDIPSGWQLCDGTSGTPDLQDSFVIGAGSTYAPDATGGSTSHAHPITAQVTGSNSDARVAVVGGSPVAAAPHTHSLTGTTDSQTELPPYYALCYIMKL